MAESSQPVIEDLEPVGQGEAHGRIPTPPIPPVVPPIPNLRRITGITAAVTMANNRATPMKPFSVGEERVTVAERWKRWAKGFDYYITASGVKDEKERIALLLNHAGPDVQEAYERLDNLANLKTSAQVLAALDAKFAPTKNVHWARFNFLECNPEKGESTDDFVTRLKQKADSCKFEVSCTCTCASPTTTVQSYLEDM